jgi:HEAT repeat protein
MYNCSMQWLSDSFTRAGESRKQVQALRDPGKRGQAAQALIQAGGESVPALLEALGSADDGQAQAAAQILVRIGKPAILQLTKSLRADHPIIRARIAAVFGSLRDPTAVPALTEALRAEFRTVRAAAASALGEIQDRAAMPDLTLSLKDAEPEVRSAACAALGKYNDAGTFKAIGDLLFDDPQIEVRQAAVRALGSTRRTEAIPLLLDALRDSFWWYERDQATEDLLAAIAGMGPSVVPPLIEALGDHEATVRRLAATLLARLRDPRALEPLSISLYDVHPDVCKASAQALAALGEPALSVLLEALKHPEEYIRQQAVIGLAEMPGPHVLPEILAQLNDESRVVRAEAIQALGRRRDPRAREALQNIAAMRGDREMAALARGALEALSDPQG